MLLTSKVGRIVLFLVIGLLFVAGFTGCSSDKSVDNRVFTECEEAVKDAADIPDSRDAVDDFDFAIRVCDTVSEFRSAVSRFPNALDGVDATVFVTNRCEYEPSLRNTDLCQSLDD